MDSTPSGRSRNRSPRASTVAPNRNAAQPPAQNGTTSEWTEPPLASPVASFEEHGGGPYGVLEDMQPLGSRPSAKVKARVKADGPRKSALQKSLAHAPHAASAQATPETTPAPLEAMAEQPLVIVDDERDDDYTPRPSKKPAKSRLSRSAAATTTKPAASPQAASQAAATPTPSSVSTPAPAASVTPAPPPTASAKRPSRSAAKSEQSTPAPPPKNSLDKIIIAAVRKSREVGNPYLGLAIQEVYAESHNDPHLASLLTGILDQTSTSEENAEFREYINRARKKIKAKESASKLPESGETKFTSSPPPESVPRQSIESPANPPKPRISIKIGKNSKPTAKPASPIVTKKRASSVSSSSSLSSLTSIEEDVPPSTLDPIFTEPKQTALLATSHETNGTLKRTSVEAGVDEDDNIIQAKKQKLDKAVDRTVPVTESHVRPDLTTIPKTHKNLIVPPVKLTANGVRSRDGSVDMGSPLTEMSSQASSQKGTPKAAPAAMTTKVFKKKAKTKQSPVKKQALNQSGEDDGTSRRASPVGYDVNEESDNNDFCSACGGIGFLLCCDGCDRSFHFSCLDPPLTQGASELEEPWYCFGCVAKRAQPQKHSRGIFSSLLSNLDKRNPTVFLLPQDIREYFDGVATTKDGRFVEQLATKTRRGAGYDELPDNFKTKDAKGHVILCYHCGLSSLGRREIITCDQCSAHWHLDCLDPPLANAPYRDHTGRKIRDWLCPLHVEHILREMDVPRLADRQLQRDRRVHMRKPRGAKIVDTSLNRGFINNGVIEISPDESDAESEFYEEEVAGVVFRLPEKGIKLDFIDKVKQSRPAPVYFDDEQIDIRPAKRARMEQRVKHDFFRRSFLEQHIALGLIGLADQQTDLEFRGDQVSNLLGALIAEAPAEVVTQMIQAEEEAKLSSKTIPPSPPASDQQDVDSQRKMLELLQTLISRKLADLTDEQ